MDALSKYLSTDMSHASIGYLNQELRHIPQMVGSALHEGVSMGLD